uniref:Uncharacterized protein n=1 Tax=Nelumbo nucifera TaxID=4432 RepID=A0A822XUJ6_NELNU|nr:TPA_asm: hypothetical protein HUJ06_025470 [Nelumbo nucifera]
MIEANAIKSVFSDHATSGALALSSTKVTLKAVLLRKKEQNTD